MGPRGKACPGLVQSAGCGGMLQVHGMCAHPPATLLAAWRRHRACWAPGTGALRKAQGRVSCCHPAPLQNHVGGEPPHLLPEGLLCPSSQDTLTECPPPHGCCGGPDLRSAYPPLRVAEHPSGHSEGAGCPPSPPPLRQLWSAGGCPRGPRLAQPPPPPHTTRLPGDHGGLCPLSAGLPGGFLPATGQRFQVPTRPGS